LKLHLDFETRSEVDLQKSGAYVYARDPSTRVLCAAYALGDEPIRYWAAGANYPMPRDLQLALTNRRVEVHAWNAQFERLILAHALGFPLDLERFRCTAALARARGLPGKLETALAFLGDEIDLAVKRKGTALMMKWCRPLPAGGYANDPDEYADLIAYCIGDVKSERSISKRLWPLSVVEQAEYLLTEVLNDRGLPIDTELAAAAQGYGDEEKQELSAYLGWMTGGVITTSNQHARIKSWLKHRLGDETFKRYFTKDGKESTDRNARADFLGSEAAKEADPEVIELIEVVDDAGRSSVSKYATIGARAVDTGRAEGSYLCWGAAQTKRYSSRGVQVHNLLRKGPPDLQAAIAAVLGHNVQGKVMHVLASLLRPTIKAPEGKVLVWGDWAAVEARGMPWLAGCQWKLDLYRRGVDVYRDNAQSIFSVDAAEANDTQRQIGKVAELSLQFGGAKGALKAMARNYGIALPPGMDESIVYAWRASNKWAAEYSFGLYRAFLQACMGEDSCHGKVSYRQILPMLPGTVSVACDLPGGTTLYYHGIKGHIAVDHPTIRRPIMLSIGDGDAGFPEEPLNLWETEVVFTKTLPAGFRTERIWHGLFAENTTQALCAALLRDCVRRVEDRLDVRQFTTTGRIEVIGHTHDEIILECEAGVADTASLVLQEEMRLVPKWLDGFPLDCSVTSAQRYGK
jgi:DNA polymerase bacteriophage-type